MDIQVKEGRSVLRVREMFVDHFNFKRQALIEDLNVCVDFAREVSDINENNEFSVSLACKVAGAKNEFLLEVEVVGLFAFETNLDNVDLKKGITEKNTIAILFPFLRSQVILLTSQPGIEPIVLPVMNINNLFDDADTIQISTQD